MMRLAMLSAVHLAVLPLLVPNGMALYVCLHDQSMAVSGTGERGCHACAPEDEPTTCAGKSCCQPRPPAPEPRQLTGHENRQCCVEVLALDLQPATGVDLQRSTPMPSAAWMSGSAALSLPLVAPRPVDQAPDAGSPRPPGPAVAAPLLN